MSTEKMREEFENSWRLRYPEHDEIAFKRSYIEPDSYAASRLKDAWWAWQASRLAIEVELPPGFTHHGASDQTEYVLEAGSVVTAIESLGLKVKPC